LIGFVSEGLAGGGSGEPASETLGAKLDFTSTMFEGVSVDGMFDIGMKKVGIRLENKNKYSLSEKPLSY